MKKIGVTGVIGSGKSTVRNMFGECGFPTYSADCLAKQAMCDLTDDIAQLLGTDVLDANRGVDRVKVGDKVFGNPHLLRSLNALIHPHVKARRRKLFRDELKKNTELVFYESALIFEVGIQTEFAAVITVVAPKHIRLERLKKNNPYSDRDIERREAAQFSNEEKQRRADIVIDNGRSLSDTTRRVRQVLRMLQNTNTFGDCRCA